MIAPGHRWGLGSLAEAAKRWHDRRILMLTRELRVHEAPTPEWLSMNCKMYFVFALVTVFSGCQCSCQPSCTLDPGAELAVSASTPIKHEPDWQGERELFGYSPTFIPNVVSFSLNNEPVMRDGFHVQRFDRAACAWQSTDLRPAIWEAYPAWDGQVTDKNLYLYQRQQRVVFDDDDDGYTHIPSGPNSTGNDGWNDIPESLLMHYDVSKRRWAAYGLPERYKLARIQFRDAYTELNHPPAVMLTDLYSTKVAVVFPEKNPDGTLTMPAQTVLDPGAFHQGGGYGANFAASAEDKTWIVWGSPSRTNVNPSNPASSVSCPNPPPNPGVPTWIIEYDHSTGTFSDPVCLGYAGDNPSKPDDNHSIPGITIDGAGTLHVVLGSHSRRFKYTSSTAPRDISEWSVLELLGAPKDGDVTIDPNCPEINSDGYSSLCHQYTYVSLLADKENTLHLASRWAGRNQQQTAGVHRISYLRKPWGQSWEPRKDLIIPFRNRYSHWYHKLSIDRRGRPFLFYAYLGNNLTQEEADAYAAKWPSDGIYPLPNPQEPNWDSEPPCNPDDEIRCWYGNVKAHDPVVVGYDQANEKWTIVTSADFAK